MHREILDNLKNNNSVSCCETILASCTTSFEVSNVKLYFSLHFLPDTNGSYSCRFLQKLTAGFQGDSLLLPTSEWMSDAT